MVTTGTIPDSERAVRPLTKLDEPEQQREAWQLACIINPKSSRSDMRQCFRPLEAGSRPLFGRNYFWLGQNIIHPNFGSLSVRTRGARKNHRKNSRPPGGSVRLTAIGALLLQALEDQV
jgi:hypothetical protein